MCEIVAIAKCGFWQVVSAGNVRLCPWVLAMAQRAADPCHLIRSSQQQRGGGVNSHNLQRRRLRSEKHGDFPKATQLVRH